MIYTLYTITNDNNLMFNELYLDKELADIGLEFKKFYTVNFSKYKVVKISVESEDDINYLGHVNTKESMISDIENYHNRIARFNRDLLITLKQKLQSYEK